MNNTKTENGAVALKSTESTLLDLFVKAVRNCDEKYIVEKLPEAWKESSTQTMQLLFQTRDIRGGKGERDITFYMLKWLKEHKPKTYELNIENLTKKYGRFLDLVQIAHNANNSEVPSDTTNLELNILAEQLRNDVTNVNLFDEKNENNKNNHEKENKENKEVKLNISLAAKWAPSENSQYKKEAILLSKILFPNDLKASEKYRKGILVPLRKKLNVVECLMCADEWDKINFAHVPASAMLLYGKENCKKFDKKSKQNQTTEGAFLRHQKERFTEYKKNVSEGKEKINVTGILPHQLVKVFLNGTKDTSDSTIELQWNAMMEKLAKETKLENSLAVVDVSGSMSGEPMEVAIALGLVTSGLTDHPFRNKIITFSENPILHNVVGNTLKEKVDSVRQSSWGMNTNLEAVFDLILNSAVMHSVSQDKMIKNVFIFTDMQFDSASKHNGDNDTLFRVISEKYQRNGYSVPKLVFWNLRASDDAFPVSVMDNGTAIVSGFSPNLLKIFMNGIDFNPQTILAEILGKYDVVIDPSEVN